MNKELNLDILVGPTHLHGGLSFGNLASVQNRLKRSNPKKAALEGLEKMKLLAALGCTQLILPPQPRPVIAFLMNLGFTGTQQKIIEDAYKMAPELLFQCTSSSSMWAANAATVSSSQDSFDGKVHISIANLAANVHRSLEAPYTYALFAKLFSNAKYFTVHPPLPSTFAFFDEGAANHTRFCDKESAVHFFVWGRSSAPSVKEFPKTYPARQTLEAQIAIMRRHRLDPEKVVFAQQNPRLIDQGVFHNDVIATGHETFFFLHEDAYVNTSKVIGELQKKIDLQVCVVSRDVLSIQDAVSSYLFNSQIVTAAMGKKVMICPLEVAKNSRTKKVADSLCGHGVDEIRYISLNQSMKNGGGPACLRLRLTLTDAQVRAIKPGVLYTPVLYARLRKCIETSYPEHFCLHDLLDPQLRRSLTSCYKKIYEILGSSC